MKFFEKHIWPLKHVKSSCSDVIYLFVHIRGWWQVEGGPSQPPQVTTSTRVMVTTPRLSSRGSWTRCSGVPSSLRHSLHRWHSWFTPRTWPNIATTSSRSWSISGNTIFTWSLRSVSSTAPWCSSLDTSSVHMASKWTRRRSRPSVTGPSHSPLRNSNDSLDSPTST